MRIGADALFGGVTFEYGVQQYAGSLSTYLIAGMLRLTMGKALF